MSKIKPYPVHHAVILSKVFGNKKPGISRAFVLRLATSHESRVTVHAFFANPGISKFSAFSVSSTFFSCSRVSSTSGGRTVRHSGSPE